MLSVLAQDELVVELDLSGQNLKVVPVEILKKYPALEKLDLSRNKLTSLKGIENCEYLLVLDARNNRLESISGLDELKELTELNLAENYLRSFEISKNAFPRLSFLDLSGNELGAWPESARNLVMLEILKLGYNGIEELNGNPPEYISLLRSLSLKGNKLRELPDWLCHFPLLVELDVSSNKLNDFGFTCFTKLDRIDLSFNRFGEVPTPLSHAKELRELNMSFNNLSVLSGWISHSNIKQLDLSANSHLDLYRAIEVIKISSVNHLILRQLDLLNLPQNAIELRRLLELDLTSNRMDLKAIEDLSYYLPRTRILY